MARPSTPTFAATTLFGPPGTVDLEVLDGAEANAAIELCPVAPGSGTHLTSTPLEITVG